MIMLSACLAGVNCKYNGGSNLNPVFKEMINNGNVILVCPEELGGLPIPRSPSEISGGTGEAVLSGQARVINKEGEDVTSFYITGAEGAVTIARLTGVEQAILRRRSPSCGCGEIYDGTFSSKLQSGDGVAAALLKKHGIKVISDEEYLEVLNK